MSGETATTTTRTTLAQKLHYQIARAGSIFNNVAVGLHRYSGRPRDYETKFIRLVRSIPSTWPAGSVAWARGVMNEPATLAQAYRAVTVALVADVWGYQGTKGFAADDKQAIVDYLLTKSRAYQRACQEMLAPMRTTSRRRTEQENDENATITTADESTVAAAHEGTALL